MPHILDIIFRVFRSDEIFRIKLNALNGIIRTVHIDTTVNWSNVELIRLSPEPLTPSLSHSLSLGVGLILLTVQLKCSASLYREREHTHVASRLVVNRVAENTQ